jgi:hypothetical protein
MDDDHLILIWSVRFDGLDERQYQVSLIVLDGRFVEQEEARFSAASNALAWLVSREMPSDVAATMVNAATMSDPAYTLSFDSTQYEAWLAARRPLSDFERRDLVGPDPRE